MSDVDVLLVDDNSGDVLLIEEAFAEREIPGALHVVQTGDDALDWLYQRDEFAGVPRPALILLDLNLPSTSGQAVLKEVKSDPALKRIPVIVLTGSTSETELNEAYEEHANAYLVKPVDPEAYADLIQSFAEFWISAATLPSVPDSSDGPQR